MARILIVTLAGTALLAFAPSVSAQDKGTTCAPGASALPAELAGWASRRPLTAATQASRLRGAGLVIGQGVDATLVSTPDVRYVVRPERPGGPASYGGLFAFTVRQAGTYRVALGAGAWIDILKDGKAVASIAHGHGPGCTGVRKMVDFPLTPGRYTLQIAGSGETALSLLVARLP